MMCPITGTPRLTTSQQATACSHKGPNCGRIRPQRPVLAAASAWSVKQEYFGKFRADGLRVPCQARDNASN